MLRTMCVMHACCSQSASLQLLQRCTSSPSTDAEVNELCLYGLHAVELGRRVSAWPTYHNRDARTSSASWPVAPAQHYSNRLRYLGERCPPAAAVSRSVTIFSKITSPNITFSADQPLSQTLPSSISAIPASRATAAARGAGYAGRERTEYGRFRRSAAQRRQHRNFTLTHCLPSPCHFPQ